MEARGGEAGRELVELVRRLWEIWDSTHDVAQTLALLDEDVEWDLIGLQGRVIRGNEEMRAWFEELRASPRTQDARAFDFEALDERTVLVSGTLRQWDDRGFGESQPAWLYTFNEQGKLARVKAFRNPAEAREAAARGD